MRLGRNGRSGDNCGELAALGDPAQEIGRPTDGRKDRQDTGDLSISEAQAALALPPMAECPPKDLGIDLTEIAGKLIG